MSVRICSPWCFSFQSQLGWALNGNPRICVTIYCWNYRISLSERVTSQTEVNWKCSELDLIVHILIQHPTCFLYELLSMTWMKYDVFQDSMLAVYSSWPWPKLLQMIKSFFPHCSLFENGSFLFFQPPPNIEENTVSGMTDRAERLCLQAVNHCLFNRT